MEDVDATKLITNWIEDRDKEWARLRPQRHLQTCPFQDRHLQPSLARLELKFSALMRVNPMARASKAMQVEPKVLTFKPHSLDVGMPVLVTRTGLGPKHIGTPPCAPAGVNHK
ncbi:hypothetical protein QYE76_030758 [Lolium multiflorum]|uniref:Uncharacterized protein n=1 Tax=Lolium multiflorum TaxID=4521 RepID=A0AAD8VJJ5_LOLMU|nr:hypothetical protein QYE76_030758 [Lolium multiflorum]